MGDVIGSYWIDLNFKSYETNVTMSPLTLPWIQSHIDYRLVISMDVWKLQKTVIFIAFLNATVATKYVDFAKSFSANIILLLMFLLIQ